MKKIGTFLLFILFIQQFASSQVFIPYTFWAGAETPVLSISDGATYNYGTNAVLVSLDKTFTVTNTSTGGIANIITGAAFGGATFTFKGGSYPGTGGTCTTTLSPQESCTIVVTAYSAVGGTFNDTITLNYKNMRNQGNYSATRAVTATFTTTPTTLAFIASAFIKVNDCAAVSVQSQDDNGNPLNVTANTTVTLGINIAVNTTLYSASNCTGVITSTVINNATNTKVFYFKSTQANQSGILTGAATGLNSANHNFTITNAPTKLKLVASPQMKISTCTALTVNTVDSNNYFSNAAANVTVNLTTNGANVYYSDSGCSSSITSTIISSGTYSKTIYTRDDSIQIVTATATDNAAVLTTDNTNINFLTSLTWWNTTWTKRMRIEINNTDQATSFTNQPVLVVLTTSNVNYANLKADGSDLRFVASDDTTVLNHEIEKWNPSGNSYIWVRIPTINASVDTDYFYVYYNNPAASDAQNKTGVWTNYWGVWHFGEDPANPSPQYQDSTSGGRHGTAVNSPTRVAGAVGYAVGLNTNTDLVDLVGHNLATALGGSSTISFWTKTLQTGNASVTNTPGVTGINDTGSTNDIFYGWLDNTGKIGVTATNGSNVQSSFTINNGAWRHITLNRDATNGMIRFFISGVFQNNNASGMGTTTTAFTHFGDIQGNNKNYDGDIDEIRIYNSVKSDAQIQADYKYMMNTHLLYNTTEVWP